MKNHSLLLLAIIVFFGFAIRAYHIDLAPRGALIDEAHFGYLAYSLLETGKDEHGQAWPIIFKGFGDQKLPGYAYVLLPVVKAIGLSTLAIRVPSVIAGTLLIIVMYLILKALKQSDAWALAAAGITAVSPWPFFMSRMGYESNLGLLFFALGLWGVFKFASTKAQKWLLIFALSWATTWYCYIAFRPVTVGIGLVFLLAGWWLKQFSWKQVALWGVVFGVAVIPLMLPSVVASNTTRFNQVGLFADEGRISEINENRTFCDVELPRLLCDVIWNKGTVFSNLLIKRFVQTYSPQYLATEGEGSIIFLTVKNYGQFYFVLYPFVILGLLALVQSPKFLKLEKLQRIVIIAGLFLAPIPTILVGDAQKVRLTSLLPFIVILIVFGLRMAAEMITEEWIKKIFLLIVCGLVWVETVFYLVNFYTVHSIKNDLYYQSYLPDLYTHLATYGPETNIILKPFYSDPLMFYAFYSKLDPKYYQEHAVLGEMEGSGFQHTIGLGNYSVKDDSLKNIACNAVKTGQKTVFVTNLKEDSYYSYVGYSSNGALEYLFVYDIDKYLEKRPDLCL
jgi:hypothetical protein